MSAYSIRKKEITTNNQKVDVLYQRIGGRWYAFSATNGEVFFSAIPDEILNELENAAPGNENVIIDPNAAVHGKNGRGAFRAKSN
jgi:hypothetical protein